MSDQLQLDRIERKLDTLVEKVATLEAQDFEKLEVRVAGLERVLWKGLGGGAVLLVLGQLAMQAAF